MCRPLDKAFWRLKCAAEGLRGRAYGSTPGVAAQRAGQREVSLSIRKARRHEHEKIVGNQMAW